MALTLKLFGNFRSYGEELILDIPPSGTVSDLKKVLLEALKPQENNEKALNTLINTSRFATDKAVLADEDDVKGFTELAILPPVSGGSK